MRKFKALLAVVLTLTMVMGMSLTAFAADKYTGDPNATYTTNVPITFVINDNDLPTGQYTPAAIPSTSNRTCTYHCNTIDGKTILDAISESALILSPGYPVSTYDVIHDDVYYGKAISSIFTLPETSTSGTGFWDGYYWKIIVTGSDLNNTYTFDLPVYPSQAPIAGAQSFSGIYGASVTSVSNFTISSIQVKYVHETLMW